MAETVRVEIARPEDQTTALRLIFQHLDEAAREDRVARAVRLLERNELDPEALLVVRRETVVGAVAATVIPGATGLIWPPRARPGQAARPIEDALLQHAVRQLRLGGARFGQCLLDAHEAFLAPALVRNGFPHLTDLWLLRHDLADDDPPPKPLTVQTFVPETAELFRDTLMRTYEGTLDIPEINGVRTADEILDGHRDQGEFDPDRWQLILEDGRPVGVLLLADLPEGDAWDVTYVGVVPEARRRGLGGRIMRHALRAARDAGAGQLTLSVDERNRPARDLYVRLGFRPVEKRHVYLAVWR